MAGTHKLKLTGSVSLLVLLGALFYAGTPAHAQTAPSPAGESDTGQVSVSPDAQAAGSVQEIVVTVRRRAESLTTVPASVTAMSSDFLQKQNIQSFADYATKIPNLTFQYGQGADYSSSGFVGGRQTTVRGVAGTDTTAYYINDTPVPSSVSPQTLDLDRIEILKGPQGTLFGASSMGGNLRFITRQPSLTQNSYAVQVQGGATKGGGFDFDGNAKADVVLAPDKLVLHTAVGYTRESGFITRRFNVPTPGSKDGQGRSDTYAGAIDLRMKFSDSLEATASVIGQASRLHGFPAAYTPYPEYRPRSYTVDRERDVQEKSSDRWLLSSLVLKYDADMFNIISSTSYFTRVVRETEDVTEGNNDYLDSPPPDAGFLAQDIGRPALPTKNIVRDRRFTQETRLSFDDGAIIPHLSGQVGVFYQRQHNSFAQPGVRVPELLGLEQTVVNTGLYDFFADQIFPTHQDNTAVFGELYYEVLPKLTVTAGLRKYWIKQKADATVALGLFTPPGGTIYAERRDKQSGVVPKAVISYQIGNQGNIYASASKGFRPGGTQPRIDPLICPEVSTLSVNTDHWAPDSLWSYEVGVKNRFANGRLSVSAAAFQIDWSNIQQVVSLSCNFQFTTNAGMARIRGAELEVSGRPFADFPLTIQLGLGYTNGVLKDPGLSQQPPNSRLAQLPRWTGSVSGYYETPVSDNVSIFAAADYSYTDPVRVITGPGTFVNRQAFNILNGNFGLRVGRSQFLVYGKNLLNKRLNLGDLRESGFARIDPDNGLRLPRSAVSRPRQLGIQYRMDF